MTLIEAARRLSRQLPRPVTPEALKQACLRGTLRGKKAGRDWTVTPKQLQNYAEYRQGRNTK